MSTATAKTPAQAAYSGERRADAAKWGWSTRRAKANPTPPDPETLARRRLEALLVNANPSAARLYACDLAESFLHHFTERYPGDDTAARAIAAGRRFAQGTISKWAWRKANTAARKMVDRAEADTGCFASAFFCAACTAGWCMGRDFDKAVYWALIWAAGCGDRALDARTATLERYCDELEALQATK